MKKTLKMLISLTCIAVLLFALGVNAFAAGSDDDALALAQKAVDINAIQNIMSRHVLYHCYGEHKAEMEEIWVQEYANQLTASFGQNQGFYVGYGSIWDAYVTGHDSSWLSSAKRYCENNGIDITGWTDEQILDVYGGVGQLLLHVTTTSIIEVADDGLTAKGYWYSPGMIREVGSSGNAIWEAYGADFIKENGEWKIWHLHMFTDFMGSFYISFDSGNAGGASGEGGAPSGDPPAAGGPGAENATNAQGDMTDVDLFLRYDYISSNQYSELSTDRLRSVMMSVPIPLPYESWSFDVPNFGPTIEEYASVGIDVNEWYAAHS